MEAVSTRCTPTKLRLAMAAMGQKETLVSELCEGSGSPARRFIGILALTVRCAKTVRRCWDAAKTGDSEIFVDWDQRKNSVPDRFLLNFPGSPMPADEKMIATELKMLNCRRMPAYMKSWPRYDRYGEWELLSNLRLQS
jgi:hypothetical protein